jgi:microcompartment protein CcmK/EutM
MARVIGNVVATKKDTGLHERTLLLIQPLAHTGEATGRPLVAFDSVGAGAGENVFYVRGSEASFPFQPTVVPSDATIVGIIDHWDVEAPPDAPASARGPRKRR